MDPMEGGGQRRPSTVVFNVGGRPFEVLRQTVSAHPSTLLATLAGLTRVEAAEPIFVDANPERFAHILDWYRYGEMFLPEGASLREAVLRDARHFRLAEEVVINGVTYSVSSAAVVKELTHSSFEAVMRRMATSWEGFEQYVERLAAEASRAWAAAVRTSATLQPALAAEALSDLETLGPHLVNLASTEAVSGRTRWHDKKNVCNVYRLQLLMHELGRRGFACGVYVDNRGHLWLRMGLKRHVAEGPASSTSAPVKYYAPSDSSEDQDEVNPTTDRRQSRWSVVQLFNG